MGIKTVSAKDMNSLPITNMADPTNPQDASTKAYTDTGVAAAKSRVNHTGTQIASTISDFDTQVRISRLDQMAAPTGSVNFNSQKGTNQLDPTSAQDSATKNYVDTSVASLVSGQTLKGAVAAALTTNVTLTAPGATLDGVTPVSGTTIFLLTGQTTGSQNGPYVWNGAAAAMTRATNWDTSGEAVLGSYWIVQAGAKADSFALLTNDTALTLGTTTPAFSFISVASGVSNGYTVTSPSISGGATWTVTHNLGSKFVVAQVARVGSPFDFVDAAIQRTTTNTLSVLPDVAMSAGEYEIMVYKVA